MEKLTKDEHYWIDEFRKGNEKALAYFFRLHYRSLCYFVSKMIQDDAEAEDIAAISFIKLWDRKDSFEKNENIKAFLFITCRNASLNFLKQLERRTIRQEEYVRHLSDIDDVVLNQVVESEFLNVLNQEVEQLPEQCSKVFSMIYFEGKKTDEIAEIMGISVKTVRNYKSRAIEILHNSFLKKKVSDALMLAMFIFLNKK
ncbi:MULTISPECIES: RNA polymerase sigma-70 factor [Pedobacter]|jgi:RNA polymerase sigma-70 factor (family 1)|uniref:RNA polymerase sigma factor n=1 Tax=Pedobacter TaxID=84567 RepID=UPI00292FD531|nr:MULTISPECIES: RNA polymerase sigma-70 factor [Pedobacter]HWW42120.1 RNA polymerase sigma-70 factor [Pedobacter sp.]